MKFYLIFVLSTTSIFGQSLDAKLFRHINDARNPALDIAAEAANYSTAIAPAAWFYLAWRGFKDNNSGKIRSAKLSTGGYITIIAVTQALKGTLKRQRPIDAIASAKGDYESGGFFEKIFASERYSMPSQSAVGAFYSAKYLSNEFGHTSLWYGWALLIGWSRIYKGAHYPGDILAGGLLGYSLGWGTVWIKEKTHWLQKDISMAIWPNYNRVFVTLSF